MAEIRTKRCEKASDCRKSGQIGTTCVILGHAMAWLMQGLYWCRFPLLRRLSRVAAEVEHHPPFIVGLGWRRFGSHSPGRLFGW